MLAFLTVLIGKTIYRHYKNKGTCKILFQQPIKRTLKQRGPFICTLERTQLNFMYLETLESDRLVLRKIDQNDFGFLLQYHSDPTLTKHLPLGKPYPRQEVEKYHQNRIVHWNHNKFGTFMVSFKKSHEIIGYCGLEYVRDTSFIDIRYGVTQNYWGKGIATEASLSCIKHGFLNLKLKAIYGAAEPRNISSIMVLKYLGMKPCREADFYGDVVDYFQVSYEDYKQSANYRGLNS